MNANHNIKEALTEDKLAKIWSLRHSQMVSAFALMVGLVLMFSGNGFAAEKPHAVVVVGTHHYTPNISMPKFAAELERLGFKTTVVNPSWDPEKDKRGLPGIEALKEADVAVFFMRFLQLADEQLKCITDYVEAGKPVVCFRTSTHGFNYPKGHPKQAMNIEFGREAFGTPYQIHLQGGTVIKPAEGSKTHPIMTGVDLENWNSPGTLYLVKPEPGITPLLIGSGKSKPGKRTNQFGSFDFKAEMTDTVAWTWTNKWKGRAFTTSLGHIGDFAVPASMRIMLNGVFWAAGKPVPSKETKIQTLTFAKEKAKMKKPRKKGKAPKTQKTPKTALAETKIKSDEMTLFYGNSFIERLQEEGSFESLFHAANPEKKQQFRSFAFTGDEVGFRIRPSKFGDHLSYLTSQVDPDRVVMCFGMNEAFAGSEGLPAFTKDLKSYLEIIQGRHLKSKLTLVSPTAIEGADAQKRNADIAAYTKVMEQVAKEKGIAFIDLFEASRELYRKSDVALTSNGLHLNEAGNQAIGKLLASALNPDDTFDKVDTSSTGFKALRKLVTRKAYEMQMAYRPSNGIHYYGTRAREFEYVAEIPHHLKLANILDTAIWDQAKEQKKSLAFPKLPVEQADPPPLKPRKGLGVIKTSDEDLKDFTVAEGFEVNLFASSEDHPELVNPLQIRFDNKGRLWVACVPSYPVPLPGQVSNDSILIFEDTDGDGKADKKTVFASGLKIPDGFVFYKDGIVVSVVRKLLWLRDTDGDDKADVTEEMLRGADDTDTHHGGYLARTPQGHIIYCEGLFHRGQFETPFGPVRTKDATALYLDPVTQKLTIQRQTSHPNPYKVSYNRWGESIQMFGGGQIIDCDYYDIGTPVGVSSSDIGMPFRDDKGCAMSIVSSPHFPADWQGGLVTGHLLGTNTVLFTPLEVKQGTYVASAKSMKLLESSNKSFRPVDLTFGTDGALYVSDFYYPIIGHAQHSVRDQNRDYDNGRIWRITRKGAPLVKAPKIDGAPIADLFVALTHPQVGIRELARTELERNPADKVLAYAKTQLEKGKADEEYGLELLWLFERHKDFSEKEFMFNFLGSKDLNISRAAIRSLRWWASVLGPQGEEAAIMMMEGNDDRSKIAVLSVASYLQQDGNIWRKLIDGADATAKTPLGKAAKLAQLYDSPSLKPEFPLLKVTDDTKLTNWVMNSGGTGGTIWLKSERSQDLVLGFRDNSAMNLNLNNTPIHRATGSQHTKNGQLNITLDKGMNKIEYFIEVGGKAKKGKADIYLAQLVGSMPKGIQYAKDNAEHSTWAKAYESENATVTENRIFIKTVASQLKFNVETFTVKAGREYQFILENPDHMLHNLVITQPGKLTAVGEMADAMASQPDAMAKHYIPETEMILFATPQIAHGKRVEQKFIAPKKPGKYPVICTFPGHWRMMKAVMIVE